MLQMQKWPSKMLVTYTRAGVKASAFGLFLLNLLPPVLRMKKSLYLPRVMTKSTATQRSTTSLMMSNTCKP